MLRHAARSLTRQPDRLPPPEAEDPPASLVVCSLEAWDDVWRRNQFLVRELTDSNPSLRVLFVEPAVDPLHELVRKRRLPHLPGSRLRPVPGRPHVLRFQPIKLGPRRFGDWVDRSIARQVIRATARAEIVEPTLWMNDLALISVANQRSWPIVYDITDDWLAASAAPRELAVRTRKEEWLLDAAHAVVVCSRDLARTKGATRHVRLIPNAVDRGHFTTPRVRPHDLPPAPVAVYVGTLHDERVDVDLIVRTAAALPELRVALIGPSSLSAQSTQRLSELPNVDLMGPRPYDDVPAYLQHATVILVPHVVSEFTESLDPIKAYECAVVGRPTIATAVAGLRDIGPPVNCVTAGEFPEAVKTAIVSPPESSTVEVPSWRRRAKDFQNAIDAARKTAALGYGTHEGQPLRVLRVWHSGVIGAWRERERELSNSGVAVHLLAAHAWNEGGVSVKFEADAAGLASPVQVAGSHPFLFLYDPRPLIRHLRRHDLSLVDLEEEPASLAALEFLVVRWLARSQVPFCLYSAQNIAKRYPPPFRWIERVALSKAAAVRVCNNGAAQIMRGKGFKGRIALIGLGADTERLASVRPETHAGFRVGYVGRLEEHKGVGVLIDAIALVPDVSLSIVGDGPHRHTLEAIVRGGLEDRVVFRGFLSHGDLPGHYATLDVVVVPSLPRPNWVEQFGRVAVEAMAAGVPVVATDCGALPDVVGDGGVVVPAGDSRALADTILRLAEDSEFRREQGARGQTRAARYSWHEVAAAHRILYEAIASNESR